MESLNTINDNCQLLILNYLSFEDQLSLFEACKKETSNRVNTNICNIWKSRKCHFLECFASRRFALNPDLEHEFLSIISPTVRHLHMDVSLTSKKQLKSWTRYKFPNMRFLDCECSKDLNVEIIAELFPGLNNMRLAGSISVNGLTNLEHLQFLNIANCDIDLDTYHNLGGLKMLEELTISKFQMKDDTYQLLIRLPKLRTISINDFHLNHLYHLSEIRADDIEKIDFKRDLYRKLIWLKQLRNLRQLTITCLHFKISNLDKLPIYPRLERIDLIDSDVVVCKSSLLKTLTRFPSLKIINLPIMPIQEEWRSIVAKNPNLTMSFEPLTFPNGDFEEIEICPRET